MCLYQYQPTRAAHKRFLKITRRHREGPNGEVADASMLVTKRQEVEEAGNGSYCNESLFIGEYGAR